MRFTCVCGWNDVCGDQDPTSLLWDIACITCLLKSTHSTVLSPDVDTIASVKFSGVIFYNIPDQIWGKIYSATVRRREDRAHVRSFRSLRLQIMWGFSYAVLSTTWMTAETFQWSETAAGLATDLHITSLYDVKKQSGIRMWTSYRLRFLNNDD